MIVPSRMCLPFFMLLPDEKKMDFVRALKKAFRNHPFAQTRYLGFPENWEAVLSTGAEQNENQ